MKETYAEFIASEADILEAHDKIVSRRPTIRTDKIPHTASEALARSILIGNPFFTWDDATETLRESLIKQANRVVARLNAAQWILCRKRGGLS